MLTADRFWSKVASDGDCWAWHAAKDGRGYGRFTVAHNVKASAHRWAYEHMVGPIPQGLELDHLCRNRACVNPAHLDPVPHGENVRRGDSWATFGAREKCPSGHDYDGPNLYVRPSDGARMCRACSREHQRKARLRRQRVKPQATGY